MKLNEIVEGIKRSEDTQHVKAKERLKKIRKQRRDPNRDVPASVEGEARKEVERTKRLLNKEN